MLQPTVRRTWAPRGQTPILRSYDRRDRITAVSAVTLSPRRRRLGLHFDLLDHNMKADDFELFVVRMLRKVRGRVTIVLDRLGAHRSAATRLLARYPKRLRFEWLPPYSPQLNPTEHVWGYTKHGRLANFVPDHIRHLGRAAAAEFRRLHRHQSLLRSFFKQARLPL